jgi:hypothetical protein
MRESTEEVLQADLRRWWCWEVDSGHQGLTSRPRASVAGEVRQDEATQGSGGRTEEEGGRWIGVEGSIE